MSRAAANQLAGAASPYLRQHADNPVHWQQWSPAALAEAAQRDAPILLSIGYAACHWCHVMAHESFEDDEVAAAMNNGFVCVKVDREERPDIDAVYMNATVALTVQGGWPMTCFLTPDGRPFFCGTYYPKAAFLQLLSAVSDTWLQRRGDPQLLARQSDRRGAAGDGFRAARPGVRVSTLRSATTPSPRSWVTRTPPAAGSAAHRHFRRQPGYEALLRHGERTGSPRALAAVPTQKRPPWPAAGYTTSWPADSLATASTTLGWYRISRRCCTTTRCCCVPTRTGQLRTGDALALRVTAETARFLLDELRDGAMFTSSLDADADGREGSTYVWTPDSAHRRLRRDRRRALGRFGFRRDSDPAPSKHGASVLQRLEDPVGPVDRLARVRSTLLAARLSRPQPGRDDKVVTGWNGLAITALAEASVALAAPELAAAAADCATALTALDLVDGRLRRASLGGRSATAPRSWKTTRCWLPACWR